MFKVGDVVKVKKVLKGYTDTGHSYDEKKQYLGKRFTVTEPNFHQGVMKHHLSMGSHVDWADAELEKVRPKKLKLPFFLLKYEIKQDPIEEYQTLKEVRDRVKELHSQRGHSFVVYEVTKKIEVSIETEIKVRGI